MDGIWGDTLGYAGAKMIRRIVGISHVADIEAIEEVQKRVLVEQRALLMAREMVMAAGGKRKGGKGTGAGVGMGLSGVEELVVMAREHSTRTPTAWTSVEM